MIGVSDNCRFRYFAKIDAQPDAQLDGPDCSFDLASVGAVRRLA
jgi:hypothetical protein